jgi:hypothetical protein
MREEAKEMLWRKQYPRSSAGRHGSPDDSMMNSAHTHSHEKVADLFQADILANTEFFYNSQKSLSADATRRLMLAVLQDAVDCFQDHVLARDSKGKKIFAEAENWIFYSKNDWLFSFNAICETFGVAPEYLRDGLMHWKQRKLGDSANGGD